MNWDDLTVSPDALRGIAENQLSDRSSGSFPDMDAITDERSAQARERLRTELFRAGMSDHIDDAGGTEALLDAIAADLDVERGLALAYLSEYSTDSMVGAGGLNESRSQTFGDRLEEWAEAFANTAPYELGYANSGAGGFGGGLGNSYDRYDA